MADIKLFNINGKVKEYQSGTVTLEKELQTVIENNMEVFFGVTFLAIRYNKLRNLLYLIVGEHEHLSYFSLTAYIVLTATNIATSV